MKQYGFSYSDGSDTLAIMRNLDKAGDHRDRRKLVAAYGVGDLGLNFYWQGAGYFLFFFYTDVVGLPNALAGAVIAFGGLVDAVADPTMGMLADRTRSRFGRYRIYLLFGAPVLSLAFFLLFWAPLAAPQALAAAFAFGAHAFFRVAYTCVSIPYGSLGANLSSDARVRTSLAGSRMFFGALGGVCVVHLVGSLRAGADETSAFVTAGAIAGLLGAVPIIAAALATQERTYPTHAADRPQTLASLISHCATNRPFVILIASILLITVANVLFVKTVLYVFERILDEPEIGAVALSCMTAAPLIALPIWTVVFRRIDKRPGFLVGCVATIISFLLLLMAGDASPWLTALACVLISSSFAAFAVGFWSILPDTIDYGHFKSGMRIESSLIGVASAAQKAGIAIAGVLIGAALDAAGYDSAGAMSEASASRLLGILAIAPIVVVALAAAVFSKYPLTARDHRKIVDALAG